MTRPCCGWNTLSVLFFFHGVLRPLPTVLSAPVQGSKGQKRARLTKKRCGCVIADVPSFRGTGRAPSQNYRVGYRIFAAALASARCKCVTERHHSLQKGAMACIGAQSREEKKYANGVSRARPCLFLRRRQFLYGGGIFLAGDGNQAPPEPTWIVEQTSSLYNT